MKISTVLVPLQGEFYSVKLNIFFSSSERLQYATGEKIHEKYRDKETGKIKTTNATKLVQHKVNEMINKIIEAEFEAKVKNRVFNLESVKKLLSGKKGYDKLSFTDFYKSELIKQSGKIKDSTLKVQRSSLNLISKFKENIYFDDINFQLIDDLESFLIKRKLNNNTRNKVHRHFKKYLNLAIKQELFEKSPYESFKPPKASSHYKYLELEDVRKIQNKQIENVRLSNVKDLFLFCIYTGLAFTDALRVDRDNLITIDGNEFIVINRQKTGTRSTIPLITEAKDILVKHGYKLPNLTNQRFNNYLKELQTICNIKAELTSHVARHTFATLGITFGMPIETVSKILGHNKLATTLIYSKILESKLQNDMMKFTEGLRK